MQESALIHFTANLPHRPYCSDDLASGLKIRRKDIAARHAYIQPDSPSLKRWLSFDIDRPDAAWHWEDAGAPAPSLVIQNPDNGHAHLLYMLRAPICVSQNARPEPLRFLALLDDTLTIKLDADHQFAGLIVKNPGHGQWRTTPYFKGPRDLAELAKGLDLERFKEPAASAAGSTLGRNCTLFDQLRFWAYKRIRAYALAGPRAFEMWARAVEAHAASLNIFSEPLPASEIKATAKSVAKWTWQRLDGLAGSNRGRDGHGLTRHHDFDPTTGLYLPKRPKLAPETVKERQQVAGQKSAEAEKQATAAKIEAAKATIKAQGKKATTARIAALAGIHRNTVRNHAKS